MPQMIIANRLNDGVVVFFTGSEAWTPAIKDGLVMESADDQQRHLATAKKHESRCLVIDPQLIEVVVERSGPRPTSIREAIRAFGPTV